jgi:hypothetical protein
MGRMTRSVAWIALATFLLPMAVPAVAAEQYREFTGRVDKINKKKMIVDNRMGDKVSFDRVDDMKVEDTSGGDKPKKTWKDLKREDWITVKWKMMDKPRKAYEVIVLPEKEEAGEDM